MHIFSKSKNRADSSTNKALLMVYLFSTLIAGNIIIPLEESLVLGIVKSAAWPLYIVTKF